MYPAVYSYKKSRTRELELSIECLKNIKEWNGDVYIVGEDPGIEHKCVYLPIKYTWGKESKSKSNDEICAYLTAADSLDNFIIMADDIYCLKPWSLEYQNRGTLIEHAATRGNDSYAKQLKTTSQFLLDNGKSNLSYEMHIPMLVSADQLKDAAEIIRVSQPMFIRSIIGNWFDIPSVRSEDSKNKPITSDTVLYSSSDNTFNYERIRKQTQ